MADSSLVFNILAKDQASKTFGALQVAAGNMLSNVASHIVSAAGRGLVAVKNMAAEAITAGSDMNETMSKVGNIFGGAAGDVVKFSEGAARNFGQSKQQAMDASATFGVFGRAANLTGGELAKFSTTLTGLAGDLASFGNTSPQDAIAALGSALQGEAEPMRRYGVLLDEGRIKARALSEGIISATVDSDKLQSAQARLAQAQDKFNELSAQGGIDAEKLADAQDRLATAQDKYNTLTNQGGIDADKLTQAQQRLTSAQEKYNSLLAQGQVDTQQVAAAELGLREARLRSQDAVDKLAKAQADYAEATRDTRVSVEDVRAAESSLETAKRRLTEATAAHNQMQRATITSVRDVRNAEMALAEARGKSQDALDKLNAAQKEYSDAIKGAVIDLEKLQDAEIASEDAKLRLADAQEKFNKVQRGTAVDSKAVEDASLALEEAQIRAAQAADKAEKATAARSLAMAQFGENSDQAREADQASTLAHVDAAQAARRVEEAQKALTEASTAVPPTQLEIAKAALDVKKAQNQVTDAERSLADLRNSGAVDPARVATAERGLSAARLEVERTANGVSDAQDKLNTLRSPAAVTADQIAASERSVADAHAAVAKAEGDLEGLRARGIRDAGQIAEAERALANARLDVDRSTQGISKAQQELTAAQNPAKASASDLAAAQYDVSQAQKAVHEASTPNVATARELAQAQKDVADAQRAVQAASIPHVASAKDLAKAQQDVADAQRAVNTALAGSVGDLTPAQKVMATYKEVLAQTTLQQGDFARTADGVANSQRTAAAEAANHKSKIGEALYPAVQAIMPVLNELRGIIGDQLVTVFQTLAPYLADAARILGPQLTEGLQKLAPHLTDLSEHLGTKIVNGAKTLIPMVRDSLIPAFQLLGGALGPTAQFMIDHHEAIAKIIGFLPALVFGLKGLHATLEIVKIAQIALNVSMAANPIGLIVFAIAGLIAAFVLLWENCDWFRDFWNKLGESLVKAWHDAVDYIKKGADFFVDVFRIWWNMVRQYIGFFVDAWNWAVSAFHTAKDWLAQGVRWIGDRFGDFVNIIQDLPGKVWNSFTNMISSIWSFAGNAWDAALGFGKNVVNGILSGLNKIIDVWNNFKLQLGPVEMFGHKFELKLKAPFHIPYIPYLAEGGDILSGGMAMVGEAGPEVLQLPAGARVSPLPTTSQEIRVIWDVTGADQDMLRWLRKSVRVEGGGNVQVALGG
jgi:hypothetical protein